MTMYGIEALKMTSSDAIKPGTDAVPIESETMKYFAADVRIRVYACVMSEAERGVSVVVVVLTLLSVDRLAKLARPNIIAF